MSKQFNDDDIIQLYQQNIDDLPPVQVDDAILAHAKQAVKMAEKPVKFKANRWWPYSGIAAAVAAIVVLAPWQHYQDPVLVSVEATDMNVMAPARKIVNETGSAINKAQNKSLSEAQAITHQTTQNIQASDPQLERLESLADESQIESITVNVTKVERAVPEHKIRAATSAPQAFYGKTSNKPLPEFAKIITKLENKNQQGVEAALIKLLNEKPEYHDDIPAPLEALYQVLLKNGKLKRPVQHQGSNKK